MKTLVFDGPNVVMRAIYGTQRAEMSSHGINTGPLVAAINTFSRHIKAERPDKVAVCWDCEGPTWRHDLFVGYKADRHKHEEIRDLRADSFALVQRFLGLCNIEQHRLDHYEADDLIAQIRRNEFTGGRSVVIVSSDKDLLQLVEQGQECSVSQVRLSGGAAMTDVWTHQRIVEEFGCEPRMLSAAMALAGDKSDGIPGVPRFGMKTAIKHLLKTPSGVAADVEHPSVAEHRHQVLMAQVLVDLQDPHSHLADLVAQVEPFEPTAPGGPVWDRLLTFVQEYDLASVHQRLTDQMMWQTAGEAQSPAIAGV